MISTNIVKRLDIVSEVEQLVSGN